MGDTLQPAGGRLIIVGGGPAAGKTTLARRLADELGAVRLAPDEWMDALGLDLLDVAARDRVERLQWTTARELLALGTTVVLDWGAFRRDKREGLRRGARALGATVELRFLDAPPDELWARVRARDGEAAPSRARFDAMLADLEAPDAEECGLYDAPAANAITDRVGPGTVP